MSVEDDDCDGLASGVALGFGMAFAFGASVSPWASSVVDIFVIAAT